jgi:hypothetical protein
MRWDVLTKLFLFLNGRCFQVHRCSNQLHNEPVAFCVPLAGMLHPQMFCCSLYSTWFLSVRFLGSFAFDFAFAFRMWLVICLLDAFPITHQELCTFKWRSAPVPRIFFLPTGMPHPIFKWLPFHWVSLARLLPIFHNSASLTLRFCAYLSSICPL